MTNKDYKRYIKIALTTAALACTAVDVPVVYAQENVNGGHTMTLHTDFLEKFDIDKGEKEARLLTDMMANFYGLDQELVHEMFLDNFDTITSSGDVTTNFIKLLEDGIALGVLIPSTPVELPVKRDRTRIEEVKNSEIGVLFTKYCNRYGVDRNLVLAQFMQESGLEHNKFNPSGAYGITQIENTLFGGTVTPFNFETNAYEEIKITEENARDLEINIQIGVAKVQEKWETYKNVYMTLQSYNYGTGMFNRALTHCGIELEEVTPELSVDSFKSGVDAVHNNPSNFTSSKVGSTYGDNDYVEHVLSYLDTTFLNYRTVDGRTLYINLETGKVLPIATSMVSSSMIKYVDYTTTEKQTDEKRMTR